MANLDPIQHLARPSCRGALAVALTLACFAACSAQETEPDAPGTAGSGGSGGGTGECQLRGIGKIEIRISGLPEGVAAELVVGGPVEAIGVDENKTLDVSAGLYVITPARVVAPDPIVRTLYEAVAEPQEFCLGAAETRVVELSYAPVATSHKLWVNASNGEGNPLAFAASGIASSADVAPAIAVSAGSAVAGRDVTFDKQGNLWAMGESGNDPHLVRLPLAQLQASGQVEPDRLIQISGIECLPVMRAFAFDRSTLWASTCSGVVALSADDLEKGSGLVAPGMTLGGTTQNGDLAFDMARNLWVTAGNQLLRYDAERLDASSDAPDLTLSLRDAADAVDITPSHLAFDRAGNLWVIDLGGTVVSQVASAELEGAGERSVVAAVSITLGVAALLERPAFDESGGLWLALAQGRLGRLSPAQLTESSSAAAPTQPETLLTSPGMGNANGMALYPASEELPLFHRFP